MFGSRSNVLAGVAALVVIGTLCTPASAQWPAAAPGSSAWTFHPFDLPSTFSVDVGARYWYGMGNTAKNLYDPTGALMVSRLTYGTHTIQAGEAVARFDFDDGWFIKGYAGGGGFYSGSLNDEDFPPGISPLSSTLSAEKNSSLKYASIDGGLKIIRGPDFHLGMFAGYHYLGQVNDAWGCNQIATNQQVCGIVTVPGNVYVITQDNAWQSVRVGAEAALQLGSFKWSVDAAWLPYVSLSGTDSHWLRIGLTPGSFTGGVPEDGTGWGYQLESVLAYRFNDFFSLGVGGRYWHMQTTGLTHFEGHVVGVAASPQPVDWRTDNYGLFLQASLKLGPYPLRENQ